MPENWISSHDDRVVEPLTAPLTRRPHINVSVPSSPWRTAANLGSAQPTEMVPGTAYAGTVIIHRGPQVRTAWLVCIALFTIPFALRAHNVRNWVFLCVVWLVIGA